MEKASSRRRSESTASGAGPGGGDRGGLVPGRGAPLLFQRYLHVSPWAWPLQGPLRRLLRGTCPRGIKCSLLWAPYDAFPVDIRVIFYFSSNNSLDFLVPASGASGSFSHEVIRHASEVFPGVAQPASVTARPAGPR